MLRYTVQLVSIAYLEKDQFKIRPIVVLTEPTGTYKTVLVAPVYSQLPVDRLTSDIILLEDFSDYGLLRPSVIRLHRITEVLAADLKEQLGSVPVLDQAKLQNSLKNMFDLTE